MKTKMILILLMLCLSVPAISQFNLNLKKKLKQKVEKALNEEVDETMDKGIDKTRKDIHKSIEGEDEETETKDADRKKTTQKDQTKATEATDENATEQTDETSAEQAMNVTWSRFDFVPGDEVIFEDAPSMMEESGEFPSRWDLLKGQVEIGDVNGENVIICIDGSPKIIPYLENSKEDYLPDVFTIEFDFYRPAKGNRMFLELYDQKNQRRNDNTEITIGFNYIRIGDIRSDYPKKLERNKGRWIHISLAFTKGKLKIYMDDTRLINIPRYKANPSGLTLHPYFAENDALFYLKNIRIAKGGVKYYDRIMQDGKIVCNGIRFDIAKASLKPESIGPINKIFKLMQKQPDLKFSVEGHTDNDGDPAKNQTLSEQRAKTVMDKLIQMGISADRLSSKGFGASKPVGTNDTPEGKSNNRRVEFVKI